jgi:hypothetical protein
MQQFISRVLTSVVPLCCLMERFDTGCKHGSSVESCSTLRPASRMQPVNHFHPARGIDTDHVTWKLEYFIMLAS